MKNFFVDLSILWKESWVITYRFCKKHWLGNIIALVLYLLMVTTFWWWPILDDWFRERVNRIKMKIRSGRE